MEIEFIKRVEALEALEADASAVLGPLPAVGISAYIPEHLVRLAELSPRAAILESWLRVRAAAVAALKRAHVAVPSRVLETPIELARTLEQARSLDAGQLGIFNERRNLRNAAVHASTLALEPGAALEYAFLSHRLRRCVGARESGRSRGQGRRVHDG